MKKCFRVLSSNNAFEKNIEERTKVNKHPRATTEASDGPGPPRRAAVGGRLFLPTPPRRPPFSGRLGWLVQPLSPTQAAETGIHGDTAIKRMSEVVTWSVLVWFAVCEAKSDEILDGLEKK